MLRWVAFAVLLVLPSSAPAALPSSAVGMSGSAISYKRNFTNVYTYFEGLTANQPTRDLIENSLTRSLIPMIHLAEAVPTCAGSVDQLFSWLNVLSTRLEVIQPYDDLYDENGFWHIGLAGPGRHYADERHAQALIHTCILNSGGVSAAAAYLARFPNLADELNVRVENGVLIQGALFPIEPHESYISSIGNAGDADARHQQPIPVGADLDALVQTQASHAAASLVNCGGAAPAISVADAHKAYEEKATSAENQHHRNMKPFQGPADPTWSQQQDCAWKQVEDFFHAKWAVCEMAGDEGCARKFDTAHFYAHACEQLNDERFHVIFPCGDGIPMNLCPTLTCSQYLNSLTS